MEEGTLKLEKADNKKIIAEHSQIHGHRTIIEILQRKAAKRLEIFHVC